MKNIFNRKSVFAKSLSVWSAFAVIVTTSAPAFAAGTAVLGGDAVLTGATGADLNTGTATDAYAQFVSSGGSSAVLDWSAFNIGAGKEMNFSGAGTTFFNLVDASASKSQIDGIISGNGNVWVINPNGIAFGAGSSVNVGGLFAAAAGNISNADELRNGSATVPSFSSFGGEANASQGAFTANQVALLGKNVTVGGDASFGRTPQLTVVAASGAVTVDEVAGGTISVDLQDFAVSDEDVVANLQSLDTIAMTVDVASQGDVYGIDVALGLDDTSTVNVKAAGYADLDGAINSRVNVEGESVRVAAYDKLTVGNVSAKSKAVLQGDFGIETVGDVSAQKVRLNSGAGGVTVKSGSTVHTDIGGNGNVDDSEEASFVAVRASGDIAVENGGTLLAEKQGAVLLLTNEGSSRGGDIEVSGVIGGNARVDIATGGCASLGNAIEAGELSVRAKRSVTIGGDVVSTAGAVAIGSVGAGDVTISGDIDSADGVTVMANDGTVRVEESAYVKSLGGTSGINVMAGVGAAGKGEVEIAGVLDVESGNGNVLVAAGQSSGAGQRSGRIGISGQIHSQGEGSVMLSAGTTGTIGGTGGVLAEYAIPGDVVIGNGAIVDAKSGDVYVMATREVSVAGNAEAGRDLVLMSGTGVEGDVTIEGRVSAQGGVTISAGVGQSSIDGSSRSVGGNVSVVRGGGIVAESGFQVVAANDVSVDGELTARQATIVAMQNFGIGTEGDVRVGENGIAVAAGADVTLDGGQALSNGGIEITATRHMSLQNGFLLQDYDIGDIALTAGGNLTVDGSVEIDEMSPHSASLIMKAGGELTFDSYAGMSGAIEMTGAKVEVGGHVQSHDGVMIAADDSIVVSDGAAVKTDGDGARVLLQTGKIVFGDESEVVSVSGGDISIGENAIVAADGQYGSVGVSAIKGSVDIKGELRADNAGTVSVSTGMSGSSMVGGSVMGGGDVNVHATGKVVGQNVFVNALGGKVSVAGAVGVGDGDVGRCVVTLSGDNGVTSSGVLDVKSGTLEVYGNRGDINLFDQSLGVVYAGDIILVAEGNVYADNPNNQIGKVTEAKAGPGKVLRIELGELQTVEIGNIVSDTAYLRSEKGTIKVVGDITAPERVVLKTENGDIIVMENCTVSATGSGAVVKLNAGRDVINDGLLVSDGSIELAAGRDIGGEGMVAAADDVAATAGGSVKLSAANGLSLGDVTAQNGDVDVSTVRGDIIVNGAVQAKAENGMVLLKAATDANADGSIIVNEGGSLAAPGKEGSVIAIAGYGKLKDEGKIDEENVVKMMSKLASAGFLEAGDGSFIQLSERATVLAGRLIVLEGQVGVVSAGLIDAREANLEVNGHTGDIDLYADNTGVVLANGADFKADGSVRAGNQNNKIGYVGELEYGGALDLNFGGVGGEVTKVITSDNFSTFNYAANGTILVIGDLESPESVYFMADNGNVAVVRDCQVKVNNGGYAYFGAAQSVMIDGVVDAHDIQLDGRNVIVGENAKLNVDMTDPERPGQVLAGVNTSFFNLVPGYVDGNIRIDGEINAYKTHLGAMGDVLQGAGSQINTCEFEVDSIGNAYLRGTTSSWVADILANGDVELGNLSASKHYPKWGEDVQSSIDAASLSGDVRVLSGRTVAATREGGGEIYLTAQQGSVMVDGTVRAAHEDGTGAGAVTVMAEGGIQVAQGGLVSSGTTTQLLVGKNGGNGDVSIDGRVTSDDAVFVTAKNGGITVGKTGVVDGRQADWLETSGHDLRVEGKVNASDGNNGLSALIVNGAGDVELGQNAKVVGKLGVVVQTENGDLHQEGAPVISSAGGRAPVVDLEPAISGGNVMLAVSGDVGGNAGGSLTVDGALLGIVSGNADVAIAKGGDLVGGTPQDADQLAQLAQLVGEGHGIFNIDVSKLGENSAMIVGGDLSLYTAGGIASYTTFIAGGDVSLSAARFGDTSYLRAGGKLTINNVGHQSHPQIAYFESVNGVEPNINNQPNDTVIFIDGRLAGGNLNILNQFGADEAFMVETPELKSTQGIFGNPPFLHSDLDVANPMAVSAVDYLIQEIPRLTLSSDFPAEVDQTIEASGLGQKDSYWFGQKGADEKQASDEPVEKTAETDKESEMPSDKTVALVR